MESDAEEGARAGIEVCLPYLDLRLMSFALSLPPFPWSANKFLLRQMGRSHLPDEILYRPKTGLTGDPCGMYLSNSAAWEKLYLLVPMTREVEDFVTVADWRLAVARIPQGVWSTWSALRPFSLSAWLQNGHKLKPSSQAPSLGGPARRREGVHNLIV
jgi:hypothetical protein